MAPRVHAPRGPQDEFTSPQDATTSPQDAPQRLQAGPRQRKSCKKTMVLLQKLFRAAPGPLVPKSPLLPYFSQPAAGGYPLGDPESSKILSPPPLLGAPCRPPKDKKPCTHCWAPCRAHKGPQDGAFDDRGCVSVILASSGEQRHSVSVEFWGCLARRPRMYSCDERALAARPQK